MGRTNELVLVCTGHMLLLVSEEALWRVGVSVSMGRPGKLRKLWLAHCGSYWANGTIEASEYTIMSKKMTLIAENNKESQAMDVKSRAQGERSLSLRGSNDAK